MKKSKRAKKSRTWVIKQHRDQFFKKAKVLGYRSRAAFKLIELNKKFNFIKKNSNLLDIGSAPGGWSQVASKIITNGKILAVDIKPMEKISNIDFIKGDFNQNEIHQKIMVYFNSKINVVLSDAAANTTGNKTLDSYRTGELCLNAMDLSNKILSKDGIFLSKLFMGPTFKEINKKAKKYFKRTVIYKPLSSHF